MKTAWQIGGGLACSLALVAAACSSTHEPEVRPAMTRERLLDPAACKECHSDHFRDWSGSMHAYASDDPVFVAMNARGQRETNGALGAFCVNCHAPMAVREGATKDGLDLATVAPTLKGVTCFFCHSADRIEGTHDAQIHLADDGVIRGPFADPAAGAPHAAAYSELQDRDRVDSARFCGACHDVVTGHGAAIERTFVEWQASVFSHNAGATCAQCHMEQSAGLRPIASVADAPSRRFHGHGFAAVDVATTPELPEQDAQRRSVQSLLDSTLQTAVCVQSLGATSSLRVLVDNVAAGHSWPSGAAQDRRAWFEVVAYRDGNVLFESGRVPDGVPVTSVSDPNLWLLRDCMFDAVGKPVHMFWEAAAFESLTLPGQQTFDPRDPRFYQGHIVQTFPRAGAFAGVPDRVTLRVRLQPIGLDVLDDLIQSGDLAPEVRGRMPTFDVGSTPVLEWTASAATELYYEEQIPVRCVTTTNFNVGADKVRAPSSNRCVP